MAFVGNCQAAALGNFYRDVGSNRLEEDVAYVDDLGLDDAQLRDLLDGVDTIVAVERDFDYGLQELRSRPGTRFYTFPMVFGGFIWPFATEPHVHNVMERPISDGPYPTQRSDSFLNRLIVKGVSPEDALEQYLALDIVKVAHVDRLRELFIDQQRARDERTGFDIASFIDEQFAVRSLYMSPHHPNAPLFGLVARQLFERMGVAPDAIEAGLRTNDVYPYSREELPIHPRIVDHFGLSYIGPDQRYRFNEEGDCTFEEYVLKYMRYENNPDLRRGIYFSSQDPHVALQHLDAGLPRSPQSSRGWAAKGYCLERLGRAEEAHQSYTRATQIAPDVVDSWLGLVRSTAACGRLTEAREIAERAVAAFPTHALARQTLAEMLVKSGERDMAAAQAREATRLLPGRASVRHVCSIVLAQAGFHGEAEAEAHAAIRIEPDAVGHYNLLAEIYEEQSRRNEALALLGDCLDRDLFNDQTFSLLGNFHLRNTDYGAAERAFARGSELFGAQRPDLTAALGEVRNLIRVHG